MQGCQGGCPALGGLLPGGGQPRRGSETRNRWPELLERPPRRSPGGALGSVCVPPGREGRHARPLLGSLAWDPAGSGPCAEPSGRGTCLCQEGGQGGRLQTRPAEGAKAPLLKCPSVLPPPPPCSSQELPWL